MSVSEWEALYASEQSEQVFNVTTELERIECLVWPPSPPIRSNSVYKNKPKDERSE